MLAKLPKWFMVFLVQSNTHFDQAAQDWNTEATLRRNLAIADAMAPHLPAKAKRLLDFGCGTGLLSAQLLGRCESLVGVDTSAGMLAQFRKQFATAPQVSGLCLDLSEGDWPLELGRFDVIVSAMAFHHLLAPAKMLAAFAEKLAPGGQIFVVDLAEEDGTFHPDPVAMGVHHQGFSEDTLRSWMSGSPLKNFQHQIVYQIEKNQRRYPVFLARFWA